MSHFEDLLARSCPGGVLFRPLATLGTRNSGVAITASQMKRIADRGGPVRIFAGGQTVADVPEEAIDPQRVIRSPSIIVKSRGHIGFAYYDKPFSHKSELWSYTLTDHAIDQRFVYYFLLTQIDSLQTLARATSVKLPQLGVKDTDSLRIPVPPLEVQREIVRILDTFTRLEAELEGELEARRRQYEHYKRSMLTEASGIDKSVTHTLSEVSDILVGFAFPSARFSTDPSDVALVRGDNIGQGFLKRAEFRRWPENPSNELGRYELQADDIVLAMDRPWIPAGLKWAQLKQGDLPALLVQRVARLRARAGVLRQGYLRQVISSAAFEKHVLMTQTGNTVPHISGGSIGGFTFAVPPLVEQDRIVGLLDAFDGLVNDLSVGLPAELAARRKQYEYYRDRLLTFEEAV